MTDRLMKATEVAQIVEARTGVRVRPVRIGLLARRGHLPIAARTRSGKLLFSDQAVGALIARQRERNDS
jgi:hypothetical protein